MSWRLQLGLLCRAETAERLMFKGTAVCLGTGELLNRVRPALLQKHSRNPAVRANSRVLNLTAESVLLVVALGLLVLVEILTT